MTQANELERLEAVVAKLLAKYEELRKEKLYLEDEVATRDMEIEDLQLLLESAKSERGDVTSRVEGLLDQIEDWEASLEEDTPERRETDSNSEEDSGNAEAEDADSEERMQHNIFNVDSETQSNVG
jgi:chromosome segregation ATPase